MQLDDGESIANAGQESLAIERGVDLLGNFQIEILDRVSARGGTFYHNGGNRSDMERKLTADALDKRRIDVGRRFILRRR